MQLMSLTTVTKNGASSAYTKYFNVDRIKNIRESGVRAAFDYWNGRSYDTYVVTSSAQTIRNNVGNYDYGIKITLNFELINSKVPASEQQTISVDQLLLVYASGISTKSTVEFLDIDGDHKTALVTQTPTRIATIAETGDVSTSPATATASATYGTAIIIKYNGNTREVPEDGDLRLRSLDADSGEYKTGDFVKETYDATTATWSLIGTL